MEWFTTSALRRMLAGAALAMPLAAGAAHWSCLGPKPGHPTPEERAAFVREVSELATRAEKMHGVPAGALAAVAIAESVYGTTRVALHAHNYFAWKFVPAAAEGRQPYVPQCALRRRASRFLAFRSKADAFDFVAAKLATLEAYRQHTEAYKAARARGVPVESAVQAWITGVASAYSQKPDEFTRKVTRVMNNAVDPDDRLSPDANLYRLSAASWLHRK
jgi:uncharacterized FlgJ-related protein